MNERTKAILEFDPIATAEEIVGKRHEQWDSNGDEAQLALGLCFMANREKAAHLASLGDTHFGISWEDFKAIATAYGFKPGFCQKFAGTGWGDKGVEEEEIIFFHEEKGMILHAESYNGKDVNSAKVYCEVKTDETREKEQWAALNGCSFGGNGNGTVEVNVDVREGFLFHLNALSEVFEFSKTWTKVPFLWFLNYMDTKDANYNYDNINNAKIKKAAPEVQKIIGIA